jgi:hypothetical protein
MRRPALADTGCWLDARATSDVVQGHEAPVSCLAFSPSGEHVASVALAERALRWWLAGSHGLFGFLGLQVPWDTTPWNSTCHAPQ